jgi:hypothetical protein
LGWVTSIAFITRTLDFISEIFKRKNFNFKFEYFFCTFYILITSA